MQYYGRVYRPPSEAQSLIIQLTIGCAHNKCTFCSMYKGEPFTVRRFEDVKADLLEMRRCYPYIHRIFLADGDALCLKTEKLLKVLNLIRDLFPECERVGIYGRAADILRKSDEELLLLKAAGLGIIYLGGESGNEEVLRRIKKGEDREALIAAVLKSEAVGVPVSMTFISGLGGKEMWREHAIDTGGLISACSPSYVGLLVLYTEPLAPLHHDILDGKFVELSPMEVLEETKLMIENIHVEKTCVFRSNHASNWLSLKGNLPQDKDRFLLEIEEALQGNRGLRASWMRGL